MDGYEWTDEVSGSRFVCTADLIAAIPEPERLTEELISAPRREILRLAEENRVLRAAPPALITLHDHDQLTAEALRDERARIKRGLLEWFRSDGWRLVFNPDGIARFEDTLDRICQEED